MNLPSPAARSSLPTWLAAMLGLLLRVGLAAATLLLMLGAVLVGVVLALGLVLWALLRGRRPMPGVFSAQFQRARRQAPGQHRGTVIDIEAREVPEPGARPGQARSESTREDQRGGL